MPQWLDRVIVHLVFSTKNRGPCLSPAVRAALHGHLAEVVRGAGCTCFRVGGVADHVHVAIGLGRTTTIARVVQDLKTSSSVWLKAKSGDLSDFAWQRGYGAFSVGPGALDALTAYIDGQDRHHSARTFEEEYRALLAKYGVAYDERYVWD
jgi:putative transposase